MNRWPDIDERHDHYLGLDGANVATEALLVLQDNLADVVTAEAMMCVHGDAGLGNTLSVNTSLRALAPAAGCRALGAGRSFGLDPPHAISATSRSMGWVCRSPGCLGSGGLRGGKRSLATCVTPLRTCATILG